MLQTWIVKSDRFSSFIGTDKDAKEYYALQTIMEEHNYAGTKRSKHKPTSVNKGNIPILKLCSITQLRSAKREKN